MNDIRYRPRWQPGGTNSPRDRRHAFERLPLYLGVRKFSTFSYDAQDCCMSTQIRCPQCQAMLRIADQHRGKVFSCPKCNKQLRIQPPKTSQATSSTTSTADSPETPPKPPTGARKNACENTEDCSADTEESSSGGAGHFGVAGNGRGKSWGGWACRGWACRGWACQPTRARFWNFFRGWRTGLRCPGIAWHCRRPNGMILSSPFCGDG